MAHVAKVKSAGVSPMVGHYAREAEKRGYVRENIDPERTALNYEVGCDFRTPLAEQVRDRVSSAVEEHERTAGKAVRKDANVMMDWVVTAPKDLKPSDQRKFFNEVVGFIQERYGKENVPGGFVHMDEAAPHVHVPVVPVLDGKLVAAKVINRADLRTFHGDLGKRIDAALGYHVSIELDEKQQGEKQLSHLDQREYIAAKDEIAATKTRLEHLQRRCEEVEPAAVGFGESARILFENRGVGAREEAAAREVEQLRAAVEEREGEIRECEAEAGRCAGREREIARDTEQVERGIERLERSIEAARGAFEQLRERVRDTIGYLANVGERAAALLKSLGVKAFPGNPSIEVVTQRATLIARSHQPQRRSLDDDLRRAGQSARQQGASRGYGSPSRRRPR